MTPDEAIEIVRSKARGRTRYEGQEPYIDEVLVAEILRLQREVRRYKRTCDALPMEWFQNGYDATLLTDENGCVQLSDYCVERRTSWHDRMNALGRLADVKDAATEIVEGVEFIGGKTDDPYDYRYSMSPQDFCGLCEALEAAGVKCDLSDPTRPRLAVEEVSGT